MALVAANRLLLLRPATAAAARASAGRSSHLIGHGPRRTTPLPRRHPGQIAPSAPRAGLATAATPNRRRRGWRRLAGLAAVAGVTAGTAWYLWTVYIIAEAEEGPPSTRSPPFHAADSGSRPRKPRLVVVGSGWAAVGLIKSLPKAHPYDVTVVSERNYFLFTPLLPSVTVGALDTTAVVESMHIVCRRPNVTFALVREVKGTRT